MLRLLAVAASAFLSSCTVIFAPEEKCDGPGCDVDVPSYELGRSGTFSQARAECKELGGRLAMPWTSAETIAASAELPEGELSWIDLSDVATEGVWVWGDGEVLEEGDGLWKEGQPNGGESQNCVVLEESMQWQDKPCQHSFYALCEIK